MSFAKTAVLVLSMAAAAPAGAQAPEPELARPSSKAGAQDDSDRSQPPADARPETTVPVVPVAPARPVSARRPGRSGTRISADTGVAFPADI